jgi:DamX protein
MAQSHPPSPVIVGDRVQQLDMLLHVQEFSSMVVLISGEPLIGKTQLLAAAEQQLSIHHQTISLTAQDVNSDEQLKLNLAQQLGCGASWAELDNKLMAIKEQGDSLILLVDDAHLLNTDLLTLLIAKSTTDQGWHLILAGDNQLRQQADAVEEQLQLSNLFHLIHLLPFTEDESDQFVQAFFKVQGQEALPISQKAMHQLWLLSKGNTGRLVELLDSQLEKQQAKSAQFPMAHVAAVLLIGCALLFSYLYQEDPVTTHDPIAELLAQQPDTLAKLPDTKPAILMKPEASMVSSDPVRDEPKPAPISSVVSEVAAGTPKSVLKQEKPVELEIKQVVQTQSVVKKQPAKRVPSHPLLNAPEQSFVLQLVGVRNEKSAQAMAKKLSRELNTDKVSFYETTYKNAPWFVVVYGPVTDKQKAKSTAQSLSKSLKSNPWIRPIAKIQEDIRKKQP